MVVVKRIPVEHNVKYGCTGAMLSFFPWEAVVPNQMSQIPRLLISEVLVVNFMGGIVAIASVANLFAKQELNVVEPFL